MMELYDRQLKALNIEYEDLFVDTRFGKTHVVKIGNQKGRPLLVAVHGSNFTMPYELSYFSALLSYFCVYAVDTVGLPGKSAQTVVSCNTMEYGEWASDVITGLGFQKMNCLGSSLGGLILVKLMCFAPEKVEKSVLIAPAGFANASTPGFMIPVGNFMMRRFFIKKDSRLKKAILSIAGDEKNIDDATLEMFKYSYEHVVINNNVKSTIFKAEDLRRYTAPTLVMVAEYDRVFPGDKTLVKAGEVILNLKTHILKGQGQMFVLSDDDIAMIKEFLEN
jgi:pimeloyl-ACP methyl ester carboxylesterase